LLELFKKPFQISFAGKTRVWLDTKNGKEKDATMRLPHDLNTE
jgi:hypothetical protein